MANKASASILVLSGTGELGRELWEPVVAPPPPLLPPSPPPAPPPPGELERELRREEGLELLLEEGLVRWEDLLLGWVEGVALECLVEPPEELGGSPPDREVSITVGREWDRAVV
jgi:hypothetical protein